MINLTGQHHMPTIEENKASHNEGNIMTYLSEKY